METSFVNRDLCIKWEFDFKSERLLAFGELHILRRLSTLLLTQTAKFLMVNTSSNPNHRRELLRRKRALLFSVVKEKRRAGHSMFLAICVWNSTSLRESLWYFVSFSLDLTTCAGIANLRV